MNSQETSELTRTLERAIKYLKQLLINHPPDNNWTKNFEEFFEYLDRSDVRKYLFFRGEGEETVQSPSEIYGVYKFFPSIGKHLESNYCKISIPGVYNTTEGLKNPVQIPLSSLLKPHIKIEPETLATYNEELALQTQNDDAEDDGTRDRSEIIVKWEEVVQAIQELHDHYQQTLTFL